MPAQLLTAWLPLTALCCADCACLQGTLVTLAIGLHNVPEGLAVATVMAAKGTSPRRTLLWTALTALPQALVAPPAFVFVDTFRCVRA